MVALLLLLSPLWLLPALSACSPRHGVTFGRVSGQITYEEAELHEAELGVRRAPRGLWSEALLVLRRYHLGLAGLAVWCVLPLGLWIGRFDPHSARSWGLFVLVATLPAVVLGFVGYRLADYNQDTLRQVSPHLATRPRVAGALLGVALGLLLGGFRAFGARGEVPSSEQPELSELELEAAEPDEPDEPKPAAPARGAEFAETERLPGEIARGLVDPDAGP